MHQSLESFSNMGQSHLHLELVNNIFHSLPTLWELNLGWLWRLELSPISFILLYILISIRINGCFYNLLQMICIFLKFLLLHWWNTIVIDISMNSQNSFYPFPKIIQILISSKPILNYFLIKDPHLQYSLHIFLIMFEYFRNFF